MKNIFLITVDDLRADCVGYINKGIDISPNLDAFAKENISFTNAFAVGPMTPLSFPGILFSMYPTEFFYNQSFRKKSVASVLKKLGYETSAFNSNPHFNSWGFNKGFDYFENFLDETRSEREKKIEKIKKKFVKKMGVNSRIVNIFQKIFIYLSPDIALPYADAKKMNEYSLNWLKNNQNKNNFCWVHYMDPHYPFSPPKKYLDINLKKKEILKLNRLHKRAEKYKEEIKNKQINKIVDIYKAEIKYFDEYFGLFIKGLKNLDLYDDSIIIFTSDHGELFGDYNRFGHQYDVLYQKQLHVPLIIKTTENEKNVISRPVSLIDIPNTILNLIGLNDEVFDGVNLISGRREYIISESINWKRNQECKENIMNSCQKNNWKLIIDNMHGSKELYNLKRDKNENNNEYDDTDICSELTEVIKHHRTSVLNSEKAKISKSIRLLTKKKS